MPPEHFDTGAFFMSGRDILGSTGPDFARDLERFALRAENIEKSQAGVVALEALVIFGQAGRSIDEERWNALAGQVSAHVRKGENEAAVRLLLPQGTLVIVDTLAPTVESARIVQEDTVIDSEALAYSRGMAILAALFRALSRHFDDRPAVKDAESPGAD